MKRKPVDSSNLISVGYDKSTSTLEVEFKSGDVWHYFGVPANIHQQLLSVKSVGFFFNAYVKNTYTGSKVE